MTQAYLISSRSPDPSTKVGALCVTSENIPVMQGYNGYPRGYDHENACDQVREAPLKYKLVEHAERNLIYNAARLGVSLRDTHLYCTMRPCTDCARGIINAGIKSVVLHAEGLANQHGDKVWSEDAQIARQLLSECGVMQIEISFPKLVMPGLFWRGKLIDPCAAAALL